VDPLRLPEAKDPDSARVSRSDLDRAAPPIRNGELAFAAPWESRAFGMAMVLRNRGAFAWGGV
jgi:hypothetical protein